MRIFAAIIMLLWCAAVTAETAKVMEGVRAKLRSGEGESYRTLRILPAKTEVEIAETGREFTRVKTADGQTGWIKSSLLQPVLAAPLAAPVALVASPAMPAPEAAQQDLLGAREQPAKTPSELEQMREQGREQERAPPGEEPQFATLFLVALAAFVVGMAVGALLLRAYYLKRLHGLRI